MKIAVDFAEISDFVDNLTVILTDPNLEHKVRRNK